MWTAPPRAPPNFVLEHLDTDAVKTVTVQIRDIREAVQEIFSNHPSEELFLKLDCEGAEYEILEKLDESGLLPKIKVIIIEWHFKGYEPLEKLLTANGFARRSLPQTYPHHQGYGYDLCV